MLRPALLALCLTSLVPVVEAATVVTGVNMPAWFSREGVKRPLTPGTILKSADIITTGSGARVLLTLPEGSEVKLGENATFRADTLGQADGRKSPFKATLAVLKGAFRFTTSLLGKDRSREVDVQVATVTAGIRGTDVWGKSDDEKDLVCLLEGKISVSREGDGTQTMDQPLSFFVAPKGQPAKPISAVDPNKVTNEWAPQTELQYGKGVAKRNSPWKLTVATVPTQQEALNWYDTLQTSGYAVKIRPQGSDKFKVQIWNLASKDDAKVLGEKLQASLQTTEVTVSK